VNTITISIDPDIFHIGSYAIGWHGVLMVLGIIVGILLTLRLAMRAGISEEFIYTSAFLVVIFGLIGARLVHVLDNLDFYSDNPGKILAFWEGGLAWYGGLLGGILAVVVYARKRFSIARFLDCGAPGVMLGLAIGRIGCTINGDAAGTPTSLPWGFIYTNPNSFAPLWIATHPAPVYEILWNMAVFGLLWWLKGRLKPDGSLFLVMLAAYSFGRFFISWVREEPAVLGPLHQAHIISLVIFIGAVALLLYRKVSWVKPMAAEGTSGEKPIDING
jgi:phosphatidylglycerol:prolipoprotein diacylglycerol transferase